MKKEDKILVMFLSYSDVSFILLSNRNQPPFLVRHAIKIQANPMAQTVLLNATYVAVDRTDICRL